MPSQTAIPEGVLAELGETDVDDRDFVRRHVPDYLRVQRETPQVARILHRLWRDGTLAVGPAALGELKRLLKRAGATRSAWKALHDTGDRIFCELHLAPTFEALVAWIGTASLAGTIRPPDERLLSRLLDLQQRVENRRSLPRLCERLPATAWRKAQQAFARVVTRPALLEDLLIEELPVVFLAAYGEADQLHRRWARMRWDAYVGRAFWVTCAARGLEEAPALPPLVIVGRLEARQLRNASAFARTARELKNCLESVFEFRPRVLLPLYRWYVIRDRITRSVVGCAQLRYTHKLRSWAIRDIAGPSNAEIADDAKRLMIAICRAAGAPGRGEVGASDRDLPLSARVWMYQRRPRDSARLAARFALMVNTGNARWIKPLVTNQSILFDEGQTDAPSGDHLLHYWRERYCRKQRTATAFLGSGCLLIENTPFGAIPFQMLFDATVEGQLECVYQRRLPQDTIPLNWDFTPGLPIGTTPDLFGAPPPS